MTEQPKTNLEARPAFDGPDTLVSDEEIISIRTQAAIQSAFTREGFEEVLGSVIQQDSTELPRLF